MNRKLLWIFVLASMMTTACTTIAPLNRDQDKKVFSDLNKAIYSAKTVQIESGKKYTAKFQTNDSEISGSKDHPPSIAHVYHFMAEHAGEYQIEFAPRYETNFGNFCGYDVVLPAAHLYAKKTKRLSEPMVFRFPHENQSKENRSVFTRVLDAGEYILIFSARSDVDGEPSSPVYS
jgi:hypothetical protein